MLLLKVNRPVNKLASYLFPKWKFKMGNNVLLPIPAEFIIAMELLDAAPDFPWSGNGGRSDYILAESIYMKNHYLEQGIKEEKIILTGALYNDIFTLVSKEREKFYNMFCLKYKVSRIKPMVLISLPQYLSNFIDRALEFNSYNDFLNYFIGCLVKIKGDFNIVLSVHPRMYKENIIEFIHPDIILSDERLEQLIPMCKFYINCESSTTRWAIACAKPVINYDFYRLNYKIFSVNEGVVTINTTLDFEKTLNKFCYNYKYYESLKQVQDKLRPEYGLLDGRVEDRMLNFFKSIAPNCGWSKRP